MKKTCYHSRTDSYEIEKLSLQITVKSERMYGMRVITISIVNIKGGTGKTTTTYNLGAALAARGKHVLLVDNDPQGSLTKSLGYDPKQMTVTLAALMSQVIDAPEQLESGLNKAIQHQDTLDLCPANQKLSGILTRLIVMQASGSMFPQSDNDTNPVFVLRSVLAPLAARYDYILIDCSPHPDLQMINALAASDSVIVPIQAHYLDAEGLPDTLELVRRVRQTYQPNLSVRGLLLTMYKGRTLLSRMVREQIEETYGSQIPVFEQPIDYSVRVAEHPAYGESLLAYAPDCPAAQSYTHLAEEVLRHESA